MADVKLQWVGNPGAHVRTIEGKEFERLNIQQGSIKVDRREDDTVVVSQEAADWMLTNEKGDWKLVKSDDESATDSEVAGLGTGRRVRDKTQS